MIFVGCLPSFFYKYEYAIMNAAYRKYALLRILFGIASVRRKHRIFAALVIGVIFPITAYNYFVRGSVTERRNVPVATTKTFYKQLWKKTHAVNIHLVNVAGNFTYRVSVFNKFLLSVRETELGKRENEIWQKPPRTVEMVTERKPAYIPKLSQYSSVKTIVMPWLVNISLLETWSSLQDYSNLVVQNYYHWTADSEVCSIFEKPGNKYYKYENMTCIRNVEDAAKPSSLPKIELTRWPTHCLHQDCEKVFSYSLFHIHIHRDALVTLKGNVISGNLKLELRSCFKDLSSIVPLFSDLEHIPLHDELFVVHQYWDYGHFHLMVEVIPKLSLYVDFLKQNPQIRIVGPRKMKVYMNILGLNASRLISGIVRGKVVYQPKSTRCGNANVVESQMLSILFRHHIERTNRLLSRNTLVMIIRSGRRKLFFQQEIEQVLRLASNAYNLTFQKFSDRPVPPVREQMRIFYSAVLIVAPHGAGLSNMLYSQPGTYIIEGLCRLPRTNLCFNRLAYILGHRYHGIMEQTGSGGKFVNITPYSVDNAVRKYLREWIQKNN